MKELEVKFEETFERILKEDVLALNGNKVDWSLVRINYVLYEELLLNSTSPNLKNIMISMAVLCFTGGITTFSIDEWFREYDIQYSMHYRIANTDKEDLTRLTLIESGKIGSIASKINAIFNNFRGDI